MQLKKGSNREEADVFPSGSCMQRVCQAQPWAPLAWLLLFTLLEVGTRHSPEVTDSFQHLDSTSICRAGVLRETLQIRTASDRAPVTQIGWSLLTGRWLAQEETQE